VRRLALVGVVTLVFAPVARAGCGVTATPLEGSAPLAVTLTAQCSSTAYTWDFGDGTTATGQSVQHVFGAGSWRPTLTTDAGVDKVGVVNAITLEVRAPRRAQYAKWVALHATVVPRLPIIYRGRRFDHGTLRVRVLGPGPWRVQAGNVTATASTLVVPTLTLTSRGTPLVGSRVTIVARLHPASAGTVSVPRVDTRTAHLARIHVTSRPATGYATVTRTLTLPIVQPTLGPGSHGASVLALEQRLAALHYAVEVDGSFGDDDTEALYAFQKVEGLPRTGIATPSVWRRLLVATVPRAHYPGNHVEVDKTRQVMFVVRDGKVALIVAVSTGATGNTPLGEWHVYRKVAGFDWVLYYPSYFLRGFAVHGYPDVPPYPASHGCVRIPMWVAKMVYADIAEGSAVYIYS
jgi:L,D-transpeptidase catalytic domain/Putative peptidoglycan binding domain/PKD domain